MYMYVYCYNFTFCGLYYTCKCPLPLAVICLIQAEAVTIERLIAAQKKPTEGLVAGEEEKVMEDDIPGVSVDPQRENLPDLNLDIEAYAMQRYVIHKQ